MIKRIVLTLALLGWLAAPTLLRAAQEHPAESAAGAHAVGEHGGGEGEHEKPPLLPDPTSREVQLQGLWVVIIFIVLLMILYPTAWKNVLAGLKAREQRIRQDITDAEAARKRAEETLSQYNKQLATAEQQVRDILTKAAADAEKIATSLKMQAQQESEEIKERATKDIDAARKQALSDIYAEAAELSTNIASKILRRNLNADDQRDLVNSSLEQLQTVGGKV
jgi:F-type H+-transporting ATPase subunit b